MKFHESDIVMSRVAIYYAEDSVLDPASGVAPVTVVCF